LIYLFSNVALQVAALTELGHLMVRLGSVVAASLLIPPAAAAAAANEEDAKPTTIASTKLLEVLVSVLPHTSAAPRAAASWCLRCMAIACPTHLTPAIDVCLEGLENLRSSPEAVVGYSSALAALLGSVRYAKMKRDDMKEFNEYYIIFFFSVTLHLAFLTLAAR
jgi:hypothetical protein